MPYCSKEKISMAITEINESQLEPDMVLSDHPYLYRRNTKELISLQKEMTLYKEAFEKVS